MRSTSPALFRPRLLAVDGASFKHQPDDYLLYPFNRYQACRYGLDGTLTDVRSGEQRSIR